MEKQTHFRFFFLLFFWSTVLSTAVKGSQEHLHHSRRRHHHRIKLFVFGDSYVDTGNLWKVAPSWKEPYGILFPGKPSGRFSDGRVLTDYVASHFGIKSPVPYEWRNVTRKSKLKYGMNFAYGGTGVFTTEMVDRPNLTIVDRRNLTVQIDNFEKLIGKNVYTKHGLKNSVALVSVAGNDYTTFFLKNGSFQNIPAFTTKLVEQLAIDLKRIKGLGVQNVVVTGLEPIGCLPILTLRNSYKKCLHIYNSGAQFHNLVLKQAVKKLNEENHHKSGRFIMLNTYKSFRSILRKKHHKGINPLEPCCVGLNSTYSCGSVDDKGVKKYSVCKNPESVFFWDTVHPTQSGWLRVFSSLRSTLQQIHK